MTPRKTHSFIEWMYYINSMYYSEASEATILTNNKN